MSVWDHVPTESELMLSLSGELLVAGELLRREFPVLLTFGGAKKWDVMIKTEKMLFRVEVVAARDPKWNISRIKRNDDNFLVCVLLPREYSQPVEYFALTKAALRAVVSPKEAARNAGRTDKGWMPPWTAYEVERDDLEPYRGNWDGIAVATGLPRRDWISKTEPE
jgi:hypothetical protein